MRRLRLIALAFVLPGWLLIGGSVGAPAARAASCYTTFPASPSTDPATFATYNLTIGGRSRSYLLYVPTGITTPRPTLLALHALFTNGTQHANQTHFAAVGAQQQAIVAFPNGTSTLWNWSAAGGNDSKFIYAVAKALVDAGCADAAKVYVEGHSEGAYMSNRIACDDAAGVSLVDRGINVKSAAAFAGGDVTQNANSTCAAARDVRWASFHGTSDGVVAPENGYAAMIKWASAARDACPARRPRPVSTRLTPSRTPAAPAVQRWHGDRSPVSHTCGRRRRAKPMTRAASPPSPSRCGISWPVRDPGGAGPAPTAASRRHRRRDTDGSGRGVRPRRAGRRVDGGGG